jgi:hypothetical protein
MNLNLNQNLLTQVKPVATPRPKGFFALILLEALIVCLAGGFGYTVLKYLNGEIPFLWMIAAALVFLAISPFVMLLATSTRRRLLVIALETAAFLGPFYTISPGVLAAAAAAIFLFSVGGDLSARQEMDNHLTISYMGIAHRKTAKMFTGLLLAGIILTLPQWRSSALPIPEKQFRALYDQTLHTFRKAYPGVNLESTVQEFAEDISRKQLEKEENFDQLTNAAKEGAIRDASKMQIEGFTKNLSFEVKGDMKVSDVLYIYITGFISNWKAGLGDSFVFIWAVILFLFLRGLGFLLIWTSLILGGFIYQLCFAFGVVAIVGEPATKERLIVT